MQLILILATAPVVKLFRRQIVDQMEIADPIVENLFADFPIANWSMRPFVIKENLKIRISIKDLLASRKQGIL